MCLLPYQAVEKWVLVGHEKETCWMPSLIKLNIKIIISTIFYRKRITIYLYIHYIYIYI